MGRARHADPRTFPLASTSATPGETRYRRRLSFLALDAKVEGRYI